MTLKTKLMVGFGTMIFCTLLVAGIAGNSISNLNLYSVYTLKLAQTQADLALARVASLRFLTTLAESERTTYFRETQEAVDRLTDVLTVDFMRQYDPQVQDSINRIESYKKAVPIFFSSVEKEKQLSDDIERNIELVNARILTLFTEIDRIFEDAIATTGINERLFRRYQTLLQVRNGYNRMRFSIDGARLHYTAQTIKDAYTSMDTFETAVNTAIPQLTQAISVQACREILDIMKTHRTIFANIISEHEASNKNLSAAIVIYNGASDLLTTLENAYSDGMTDAGNSSITMAVAVATLATIIGLCVTFFIIKNVFGQLGADPAELYHTADSITNGNYNVDDGMPKIGVYSALMGMAKSIKENIEDARAQSQKALEESEAARVATEQARIASLEAEEKAKTIIIAADKLADVANVVNTSSSEIADKTTSSVRTSEVAGARIDETATAMNQMTATVVEVARSASNAAQESATTRQKAETGANIVQQSMASINLVQKDSLALKNDMFALSQQAQSITQIMAVISDIADQTNLLALNAAIEAARAGEAGRGFAVVADEVRKLAEKTMHSTGDVSNAIQAIQTSTEKSMAQVDATVHNIEKATALAEQSGVALEEIVGLVDSTADQVRAIATAAEEQSSTAEEINRAITDINEISTENAESMKEAGGMINELSNQAQILDRLIGELRNS